MWGHFWSSWGCSWVIFGRLEGRFGPLGGVLGCSAGVLEALGALLGRVDASGGGAPDLTPGLGSVFGPILGAKREPRWSPKRTKIEPKIVLKNGRVLEWS